jgi:hypothetical protein
VASADYLEARRTDGLRGCDPASAPTRGALRGSGAIHGCHLRNPSRPLRPLRPLRTGEALSSLRSAWAAVPLQRLLRLRAEVNGWIVPFWMFLDVTRMVAAVPLAAATIAETTAAMSAVFMISNASFALCGVDTVRANSAYDSSPTGPRRPASWTGQMRWS